MTVRKWAIGIIALSGVMSGISGVMLMSGALAQPPKKGPVVPASGTTTPAAKATTARPADSLGNMLAEAKAAHAKLRDYSGSFTRQERINGTLSAEQVGEMKARVKPVGMYVRFVRPEASAGMEVAYSDAARDGKLRYRPAGIEGSKGFKKIDPVDPKFLAENRHAVADWGIGAVIERVATATARERTLNNPVEVYTSDYRFANRNVTRYEILTRRPHAFRYAARMVVFVDTETKLPIRFEAYDDPKSGATTGELLEAYSFTDLKFNVGVGESSFDY